ncbi:MAG: MFS transporter [Crocinitomicaceae bacterium]|nr:MFS transporter [Crocinitomicaceae bacterium]
MQNRHAIFRLLTANTISSFAQGISLIAIPWYFASILNMEVFYVRAFTIITFFTFFLSLYSGTVIDRYSRKNIFLGINAVGFFVLTGASLIGYVNDGMPPWLIVSVLAFAVFTFQIHFPNLYAFGQEVVSKDKYGKFGSLIEVQNQAAIIFSGVFAVVLLPGQKENASSFRDMLGFRIEPWELHEIFLLNGITYFIAFVIISGISYKSHKEREVELGKVWHRLKSGYHYLKRHRSLFVFGIASHAVFVVMIIHGFYLINLYIDNYLKEGAGVYAVSEVLYSIGALFAGFFIRKIFDRNSPILGVIVLMSLAVIIFFTVALTKHFLIIYLFQFFLGISNAGIRVLRLTYLLTHVDNSVIGRTESIFNSVNISLRFILLSLFSLAFFSEGEHVANAYIAGGIFIAVATVIMLVNYFRMKHE